MIRLLIDADACPVKDEIYKVADRHRVPVTLVSNSYFRFPRGGLIELQVVSDGFDAADDWIAENAGPKTVVVTADILLAQRCLDANATVLGSNGKPFTDASIGNAVATRGIMADLRASVAPPSNAGESAMVSDVEGVVASLQANRAPICNSVLPEHSLATDALPPADA